MLKKLVREPLAHFILIGAALFVGFEMLDEEEFGESEEQILVPAGRIAQLENLFAKTWQRPPSQTELEGLVDDFINEEIAYREALALGIDRDDTVIRRRLRQKFEFLTEGLMPVAEPTDAQLEQFLAENAEKFRDDSRYTFEQFYINPDRHSDLEAFVRTQKAALVDGQPVTGNGLLPVAFVDEPSRRVDGLFGTGFTGRLDEAQLDTWEGPIESGVGLHLVRLSRRVDAELPSLESVRAEVSREWSYAEQQRLRIELQKTLREQYEVVIEWPEGASSQSAVGETDANEGLER